MLSSKNSPARPLQRALRGRHELNRVQSLRGRNRSPISKSSQVSPVRRIHGDKGYQRSQLPDRFKVWISGQVRRVKKAIRREMLRRAPIKPVIGYHRVRRNHLKGRRGDRINAVLAAAG
jgi:hypothetical protein